MFGEPGAEILYLNISNDSRILASGGSVELTIPRHKGLSIKVPDNKYPPEPKSVRKYDDRFSHILPSYHNVSIPDLRVSSDAKNYYIKWRVNRLQAQTELEADEYVLMKTDKPIDIQCTIFCDELPEPTQTTLKANPPQGTAIVSIDELSDDSYYAALRNKIIMDGYVPRVFEEMMEERVFSVDHSTINLDTSVGSRKSAQAFCQKKKRPGGRWRMDETYLKSQWQVEILLPSGG